MKLPEKEKQIHKKAFLIWYGSGATDGTRKYRNVQEKLKKSLTWVEHVASHFKWKEKAEVKDKKANQELADRMEVLIQKSNDEILRIIEAYRARWAGQLASGNIKMTDTGFERMMKLERLIANKETERFKIDNLADYMKGLEDELTSGSEESA